MDNREFDLISTDIREYTLRFQEAMLSFLRDCIIKRMYGSEDELIEALDSYNEKNPSFGILNEADSTADFNPSPYGRMDLAAAMKILRFMENESTTHISKRFLDTFSINEVDSYAKRLKTGNESRNIFAHYNKNKKVSF